jgi:hypothetical protein
MARIIIAIGNALDRRPFFRRCVTAHFLWSERKRPSPKCVLQVPSSISDDVRLLHNRSTAAAKNQGDDQQNDEDEQEDPRDVGEIAGKITETEDAGKQSEDGEYKSPAEHKDSSFRVLRTWRFDDLHHDADRIFF